MSVRLERLARSELHPRNAEPRCVGQKRGERWVPSKVPLLSEKMPLAVFYDFGDGLNLATRDDDDGRKHLGEFSCLLGWPQ